MCILQGQHDTHGTTCCWQFRLASTTFLFIAQLLYLQHYSWITFNGRWTCVTNHLRVGFMRVLFNKSNVFAESVRYILSFYSRFANKMFFSRECPPGKPKQMQMVFALQYACDTVTLIQCICGDTRSHNGFPHLKWMTFHWRVMHSTYDPTLACGLYCTSSPLCKLDFQFFQRLEVKPKQSPTPSWRCTQCMLASPSGMHGANQLAHYHTH